MTSENVILLFVMLIGVIGKNHLLTRAAGILLVVSMMNWGVALRMLEKDGLDLGILLLTIAVLAPLATGTTGARGMAKTLWSMEGMCALVAGALAAVLTAQGVGLLRTRPSIIVGLAVGSILGAGFLGGIPAGPLVAAGFAAVVIKMLGR